MDLGKSGLVRRLSVLTRAITPQNRQQGGHFRPSWSQHVNRSTAVMD